MELEMQRVVGEENEMKSFILGQICVCKSIVNQVLQMYLATY